MKLQGGLILLKEILEDLPFAEKKVALYVLNNPMKVVELNITQIAKACGSNVAGVVRLSKRLGMKGFRELKLRVTCDVSQHNETKRFLHIEPGFTIEEISHSIVHNSKEVLDNILKILDIDSIEAAAGRLLSSKRIDIYGVGASGIVAQDLFQKLLRIGMICSYNPDTHLQLTSACGLGDSDTAIAISYSGETNAVIMAVREAKKSNAFTVSITRFGINRLAEICDINLFVPSTEPLFREGAMASRIAQLVVVDILFSVIASRGSNKVPEYLTRTMNALKQKRN